eukprot:COSAG06_NODE_42951_length_376_cov_6.931408_1_plen_38_part_01
MIVFIYKWLKNAVFRRTAHFTSSGLLEQHPRQVAYVYL